MLVSVGLHPIGGSDFSHSASDVFPARQSYRSIHRAGQVPGCIFGSGAHIHPITRGEVRSMVSAVRKKWPSSWRLSLY